MPRLSHKTPRRQFDPGCPPASADLYEGLHSVTPVTESLLLSHARPCYVVVVVDEDDDDEEEEGEDEEEADGDGMCRNKNKNPTTQCGEK